jgi:N-acetyl-gamma-glutamyl-phosphate reductase
MIEVGIVGGTGYTAGELIRVLLNHKKVNIKFVFSTSHANSKIADIHDDLIGDSDMKFKDSVSYDIDLLFLAVGHGFSKIFLEKYKFPEEVKIIDLGNDFRLNDNSFYQNRKFVYGLPEINKEAIKNSDNIANPGCFATAIQLAILPLASVNNLNDDVHVNAVTGATGVGKSLTETTHFTWRQNNFSSYKPFEHQHLDEIMQSVQQLQGSFKKEINFIPNRGNFSRGIFASIYTKFDGPLEEAVKIFKDFYKDAVFVHVAEKDLHLKQVVNTNKCLIHLFKYNNKLLISSIIDNLLKGASGQAIQNMNLMFGFKENEGLQLKALYF